MREFAFELRLCARLERDAPGVVARQVGASVNTGAGTARVVDVLSVEPGPAFDDRVALGPATIPPAAVESGARVGEWRPVTDVFDAPPARARRLADRAVDAGFFERAYRDGREVVRRAARYPDWFGRLVGVENKPDLSTPGDLATQLRKDVSLGLLDAVILATGSHVTRAHRNRIPEEVGVWRVDFADDDPVEVVREPTPLDTAAPGVQVLAEHPGRTDVTAVSAAEKARQRRRMAERAYGKGWRAAFPACATVEAGDAAGATVPYCPWKGRLVHAASDCGPDCAGHDPGDPPPVDLAAERERRTLWIADPDGRAREQAGLDRFG